MTERCRGRRRFQVLFLPTVFLLLLPVEGWAQEGLNAEKSTQADTTLKEQPGADEQMTNRRLLKLLKKHFPDRKVEGPLGLWRIEFPKDEPADEAEQKPQQPADEEDKALEPAAEEIGPGGTDHLDPVMVIMTDERADRMRIMIPIRRFDTQRVDDLRLALIALHANYDRALDARYAIHDGFLWSAFIHPLSTLTPRDLENALLQVRALRDNTGTTYSSSELLFAPQVEEGNQPEGEDGKAPANPLPGDNVT